MISTHQSVCIVIFFFGISLLAYVSPTPSHFPALDGLRPAASPAVQVAAVEALLKRVLPKSVEGQFKIVVNESIADYNFDKVVVSASGKQILVTGSSGVAASWGVSRYLRTCCNVHFSWDGFQVAKLNKTLPLPKTPLELDSLGRFRYFANVCTFSYSMQFWNFSRWEQHIDWMVLNGINLPLAMTGQEYVWMEVFKQFGLSDAEVLAYFSGPAFLAWNRMGNLRSWGGPLSKAWLEQQLELQKKILAREVSLGMVPVLPGFAGHVPDAMEKHYPNVTFHQLSWNGFNKTTFLDVEDPLFVNMSQAFVKQMNSSFGGIFHAYNADPFNEMTPPSYEPSYFKTAVTNIYKGMQMADKDAVWVMQGWFLVGDQNYFKPGVTEALFDTLARGQMLMLDLYSEQIPIYSKTQSYMGQPFVWNMLHNFGGNLGLYGSVEKVNKGVTAAMTLSNSTMVGTGLTMEGMFQNYAMYQLALDRGWSKVELNLTDWITSYAEQRYSVADPLVAKAWNYLWSDIYNYTGADAPTFDSYIITKRPGLKRTQMKWYSFSSLCFAWSNLVKSGSNTNLDTVLFKHDLVDVTREILQQVGVGVYTNITKAYSAKDLPSLRASGSKMVNLMNDLDTLLNSLPAFSLKPWLDEARRDGTNSTEASLWDYGFRNQLTTWGPSGEIEDYARKQWSGLVKFYYLPRWKLFATYLEDSLKTGKGFSQSAFDTYSLHNIELPFQTASLKFDPPGDAIEICNALYGKYHSDCFGKAPKMNLDYEF